MQLQACELQDGPITLLLFFTPWVLPQELHCSINGYFLEVIGWAGQGNSQGKVHV